MLSAEQAPPSVSWRPQVSATMVSSAPALARHQPRAGGQVDVRPARGWCPSRCSARRDRGVEEQRVDRLVAFEVDDAEDVARRELVRPPLPRRQRDVDRRGRGIELGRFRLKVTTRPRRLHLQDVALRQREAAPVLGARQPAQIVRPPRAARSAIVSSTGLRRILGRRIERVRRVRQHHQHVHLGAQLDGRARRRLLPGTHAARRRRRHRPHEEVHVGHQVALAQPVLAQLDEEVVVRVAVEVVARVLVAPSPNRARAVDRVAASRRSCRASRTCPR